MKLSHIVSSLEEQYGGPSKSVRALCDALGQTGHEVSLLTTHPTAAVGGETSERGRLRITQFRRGWPGRVCASRELRDAVLAHRADVVHHHALWLRPLHYARLAARRHGAPLVISPRGMMADWAWHHHRGRKQIARLLVHPGALEAAAGWHATSAEEAQEIRARGFEQPVCVAPNGVEQPTDESMAVARAHWHAACPAAALRPVALFYSRLHRKKRVRELIDAWLDHGPKDWLLLVIGIPEDYTAEELRDHAQRRGGGERVAAFSGLGRPPPYAVASLFLLPSHNENFGLVIAEALAHGVPAVVTDTTPWSGLNRDERGWCVPWADYPTTLRQAAAEGVERLRERGERARDWVLREFSWARSAATLSDFYAQLKASRA
jgi:glycosyltransferase involved in cell wall biosynthesis